MRLFRFLRRKSELTEEIESHLNMAVADRMARGQSPADARKLAIQELGNVPMIADATRDQWGWLRLELSIQDLRYALRQLRKDIGFTLTVVITLALGVGANTAIFTLVQGILLRSLPVNDPSRLYRIGDKNDCCYYNNYQNDNGDFDLSPTICISISRNRRRSLNGWRRSRREATGSACVKVLPRPGQCEVSMSPATTFPPSAWVRTRGVCSTKTTTRPGRHNTGAEL
jgi:hypothetical protein